MMANLPWLSVGSCSELDSVSSVSLLHSIYGSQVSQILLASDDSDLRVQDRPCTQEDLRSRRPKSSPAVTRLERQQHLRSSSGRAFSTRPSTAHIRGPASRSPVQGGGAAVVRPRSALPQMHRVQSSLYLEDLEDDREISRTVIHETKPVSLSRVPEYVNFWQGKPLSERERVVPSHTRRAWKRPKSDYGSRDLSRGNNKTRLATVMEGTDDSVLVSANKSADNNSAMKKSHFGDHDKNSKNGRSNSTRYTFPPLSVSPIAHSGSGWDNTGRHLGSGHNNSRKGDRSRRSAASSVWGQRSQNTRRNQTTASSCGESDDDHFCQDKHLHSNFLDIEGSYSRGTRFELPMDIRLLEGMSPLQYLKSHCIISNHHMLLCSQVFTKHDKDRDACLSREELKGAMQEALHGTLSQAQTDHLLELVQYPSETMADLQLFAALCCLAGRAFSLSLMPALAGKEVIEIVDFEALEWKLRGCSIGLPLQNVFALL